MMTNTEFINAIESYLETTGLSAAALGKRAVKDTRIVYDIRNGRECRERTRRRIISYMQSHPKGADFYEARDA